MAKTLRISPDFHYTRFRMLGLSMKKAGWNFGHDLCRDETGYFVNNDFILNGKTAQIAIEHLVNYLAELYVELPFDKIVFDSHYEITGDELLEKVKQKVRED